MINQKAIEQELDQLKGLIILVETYESIAGTSVRRIRSSVLANREFHVGLNRMFREIIGAYKKEVSYVMKKKKIKGEEGKISLIKDNGKTALIFFSSNTGLYGDVINRTFVTFLGEIKKINADIVVVGRMGKVFFEEAMPGTAYAYFDFPDNAISVEHLKEITAFLAPYEKVVAFYAVFQNLLTQQVRASIVSGAELPVEKPEEAVTPYFFEPSLEEVTVFFEKEIFGSLLEQVLQESRLAKLASRMVLLDRAIINIESALKKGFLEGQKIHHRIANRELLDSLSGFSLWG